MTRLLVHVEGETEESFVNEVLRDHLLTIGYENISARIVGNARLRSRRGGIRPWPTVRGDIIRHLKEDKGCIATTMVDYYALPQSSGAAWPGRADAAIAPHEQKTQIISNALSADLVNTIGGNFNSSRFVPYVVMHEFEGLLFSDCKSFGNAIGRSDLITHFQEIRDQFSNPEEINDSPITAPSKRVEALVVGYQKPLFGTLAALAIGLPKIRAACPNFNDWITHLESLV